MAKRPTLIKHLENSRYRFRKEIADFEAREHALSQLFDLARDLASHKIKSYAVLPVEHNGIIVYEAYIKK